MTLSRVSRLMLIVLCAPAFCFGARRPRCYTVHQASRMLHKDVCVSAHVYNVVQLPDGTRFLDLCPPTTSDAKCRFTIVSLKQNRDDVGNLKKYKDKHMYIRGIVLPMGGRAGIVLSQIQQVYTKPPGFKPNERLLRGFNADSSQPPVYDPNLRTYSRNHSRTNSRDQETQTVK